MPTCNLCTKSGWFLKLSKDKLCDPCNFEYLSTVTRSGEIVQDSIKIIQTSKNAMTRLSRIKVAIEICHTLDRFHRVGLTTITPPPGELAKTLDQARSEVVNDFVQAELLKVRAQSSSARTRASKLSPYSRLLAKVAAFYSELKDVGVVDLWDQAIRREMATVEVRGEVEEAERLEHRGEHKKALGLYRDALFALERSDLPVDDQREIGTHLNNKIAQLAGERPPRIA